MDTVWARLHHVGPQCGARGPCAALVEPEPSHSIRGLRSDGFADGGSPAAYGARRRCRRGDDARTPCCSRCKEHHNSGPACRPSSSQPDLHADRGDLVEFVGEVEVRALLRWCAAGRWHRSRWACRPGVRASSCRSPTEILESDRSRSVSVKARASRTFPRSRRHRPVTRYPGSSSRSRWRGGLGVDEDARARDALLEPRDREAHAWNRQ